jgi:hypothetical protein
LRRVRKLRNGASACLIGKDEDGSAGVLIAMFLWFFLTFGDGLYRIIGR